MANQDRLTGTACTFEEIGKQLNIEASTARALYASGLRKLRSRRATPLFQNLMRLVESKAALR